MVLVLIHRHFFPEIAMRLSFLLGALLALASFAASADMARLPSRGAKVPLVELHTMTQGAEEDRLVFLKRAGVWMHNYTVGTNEEVCANICAAPNGHLSLRLTTNGSHLACGITNRCVAGSKPTGESIHSHPHDPSFRLNATDIAFLRDRAPGQNVQRYATFLANAKQFSEWDYALGAGYLVADGQLLYQKGPGTATVLGDLPLP